MNIKLIVFDMAGTTIDEDNAVYKTVLQAVNQHGYHYHLEQVLAVGAGKEKSQAIRDLLALDGNTHSEDEIQTIFADFKTLLSTVYSEQPIKEQPGAAATFEKLHQAGIKVALDTGYNRTTAQTLINQLNWRVGHEIDALITASDVTLGRPHAEMIQLAMSLCGVSDPATVVKIGDSQIDIEEGQNAQCGYTFGITTGAQTRDQLAEANPTTIVDSLDEMLSYLKI